MGRSTCKRDNNTNLNKVQRSNGRVSQNKEPGEGGGDSADERGGDARRLA